MKTERLIFAIEGVPAKILRQIHDSLSQKFSYTKVIERVTDIAFSNLETFDVAVFWLPKDREKAESFIRNVQLRSKSIPIHLCCADNKFSGIEKLSSIQKIHCHEVVKSQNAQEICASITEILREPVEEGSATDIGTETEGANQFLSMLVEELNNPLSNFAGTLNNLGRELKSQNQAAPNLMESMTKLEKTLWLMEKTVLSFSNLIGQERVSSLENCKVRELLDSAIGAVKLKGTSQKVTIQRLGEEDKSIICNKNEIRQIIINLFINAVDSVSDAVEKFIQIESKLSDDVISIRFIDGGNQLTSQNPKMFEVGATNQNLGLGLVISKKLAEKNGGRLFIDPDSEKPSVVLILPRDQSKINSNNVA